MNRPRQLNIPSEELAAFCRSHQVRELSLFGSILSENHSLASDVDILVSFEPAARITFLTLGRMQRELEAIVGRKVDLVPKEGLKPLIRDQVLESAQVLYAA